MTGFEPVEVEASPWTDGMGSGAASRPIDDSRENAFEAVFGMEGPTRAPSRASRSRPEATRHAAVTCSWTGVFACYLR